MIHNFWGKKAKKTKSFPFIGILTTCPAVWKGRQDAYGQGQCDKIGLYPVIARHAETRNHRCLYC